MSDKDTPARLRLVGSAARQPASSVEPSAPRSSGNPSAAGPLGRNASVALVLLFLVSSAAGGALLELVR